MRLRTTRRYYVTKLDEIRKRPLVFFGYRRITRNAIVKKHLDGKLWSFHVLLYKYFQDHGITIDIFASSKDFGGVVA